MIKRFFYILLPVLLFGFSITINDYQTKQRNDGSGIYDINYAVSGIDDSDSVHVYLSAITSEHETLDCITFNEPSDIGRIYGSGEYHIEWDIKADYPNREFRDTDVKILLAGAVDGHIVGRCYRVMDIYGGENHSILLFSNGTVWATGDNTFGQVGDDTSIRRLCWTQSGLVSPVGELDSVIKIDCGYNHSYALRQDGSLYGWGANIDLTLGDGTNINRYTPIQIVGADSVGYLEEIMDFSRSDFHTLVLDEFSRVLSWGWNDYGQLGTDDTTDRSFPVFARDTIGDSDTLKNIVQVESGYQHSLAIREDGELVSWGINEFGQLGCNKEFSELRFAQIPVHVKSITGTFNLDNIIDIAAGQTHSVALKSDGTVLAWGHNLHGQLGDGTNTNRIKPVQVYTWTGELLNNIVDIEAGGYFSIALRNDGTVWTWGRNNHGQLGDRSFEMRTRAVRVDDLNDYNIIKIGCGNEHAFAYSDVGILFGWGKNITGTLGDNTNRTRERPVESLLPF